LPCTFDGWVALVEFYIEGFSSLLATYKDTSQVGKKTIIWAHHPKLVNNSKKGFSKSIQYINIFLTFYNILIFYVHEHAKKKNTLFM
jgi:hypothetical protein